jgi:hypothetical protein
MKAILIDPTKREVRGIEVELTTLSSAFTSGPHSEPVKVALTMTKLTKGLLVSNAWKGFSGHWFGLVGSGLSPIHGRGLLLGYERDGQGLISTTLTVREVEKQVRFGS